MRCHWSYLKYIVRHKWYVFIECCKAGIPWRGIVHDWHKFLPSEWFPYVHYFYNPDGSNRTIRDDTGYYKPTDTGNNAFDFAWLLHQKRARHHWQWWILICDNDDDVIQSTGNQQEASRWIQSIVSDVALSDQLRTFQPTVQVSAESSVDSSVQSTGGSIVLNNEPIDAISSERMISSDTGKIQRSIVVVSENRFRLCDFNFCNTIVAICQCVLAAVRAAWNFCVLTILTVAEIDIEKRWEQARKCIAGLLRTTTQTDSESSAITAIPHLRTMDTVPIRQGQVVIFPMSDCSRKEMLCDWRGAGRAVGHPDTLAWYEANKDNMQLHPDTRNWIEVQLR